MSPDEKADIRSCMSKARTAIKMSPTRRKRFLGQLKLLQCQINGEVKPAKVPVPKLQRHYRKQLVEPCLPCPMHWELSAASSQSNYVALDGPPVHLDYPQRRSPSGYRDAATFLRRLGDGSCCVLKRRRETEMERPQEIKLLAPRQSRAGAVADPIAQDWRDVTKMPRVACTEGGYVKVYYGGEAAAQLQQRASARLPSNLRLRGHRRALMFFVSTSASNSTTNFDETPFVLYCLCGERTVWLAPPEAKRKLGLRARVDGPLASETSTGA